MRIITGKYKGRRFDIPRTFKARPTTDFAKENIFNVLSAYTDFDGIRCLDLFAGTGSITLEMLSRGAREVVSVESDRDHMAFIRSCLEKTDSAGACRTVCRDVFRFLKSPAGRFDLVFADPPYSLERIGELPALVLGRELLSPGGVFVLEHGASCDFSDNPRFNQRRTYGSVNFSIFL